MTKISPTIAKDPSPSDVIAKAEDLRLQGNDAYKTEDWERALQLYKESVSYHAQAPAYSNMAAVLHKLGQYEQACQAAKEATQVNPQWAKGWWRRGVAAELVKDFESAHRFYLEACKLEKTNRTFRKHLETVKKRLKVTEEIRNGMSVKQQQPQQQGGGGDPDPMESEHLKAYRKIHQELGGPLYTLEERFTQAQIDKGEETIDSEQYLFHGIIKWITGMKCSIADLTLAIDPRFRGSQVVNILPQKYKNKELLQVDIDNSENLFGGYPTGNATVDLITGFATLAGRGTFVEMAPGRICPQPNNVLRRYMAYQVLAQLHCITKWMEVLQERDYDFGPDMKCSPAVVESYGTYFSNLQQPPVIDTSQKSMEHTPQEIVDYILKDQIETKGRSWETDGRRGGLRQYVELQYCGTILYAIIQRGFQMYKRAYECLSWANEFITLLDNELEVTHNRSFEIHGWIFQESICLGVMMAELDLFNALSRSGQGLDGPYPMRDALDLCTEISSMATREAPTPPSEGQHQQTAAYDKALDDVICRRKPLAMAHSQIAYHLNILRSAAATPQDFSAIVDHHGLADFGGGGEEEKEKEEYDAFALVAEHYRIAAENELPDAAEGTIYWWGYAASMAQAGGSPQRTLGELRRAIRMAQANEKKRNIEYFGDNMQKNGEYESIAKLTAAYFEDKPDSFVFPKIVLNPQQSTLTIGDNIVCNDFAQYRRNEEKSTRQRQIQEQLNELMDTTELEKQFGRVYQTSPPSLATLAVRELHKAGASFAKGESNGDRIIENAMREAGEERIA